MPRPRRAARQGRPPLPESERLKSRLVVQFRLTDAEADALWRRVLKERTSLNDYVRDLIRRVVLGGL
jgi:hypothetical protein